ncbi:hypothetical protein Dimus_004758 [Dionaea muscipula]
MGPMGKNDCRGRAARGAYKVLLFDAKPLPPLPAISLALKLQFRSSNQSSGSSTPAMATVTSRDVQEIINKISSDKPRYREEGIKLLNAWLEGERSLSFCKYIGSKTAALKPKQLPHSETWPFLIKLLIDCTMLEISASKRRAPKLIYAKTLRIVVQRTVDTKGTGHDLSLITVAKTLFGHVWDVLREVPSFQSEYGVILRHLLTLRDYRLHMRKRVYCGFVLFYMEKVKSSFVEKNYCHANLKEEVFRCILTLHSLLENPPGGFPDSLRVDVVKGFIDIFAYVRDEGKISRKLIECLNTYLLEDGPNLGIQCLEIHNSMKDFVFRSWNTTHDRSLKDTLTLYARLQLNLTRGDEDGGVFLEQLLEVVGRELDLISASSISTSRADAAKDERFGALTTSQQGLVELASLVFYRACTNGHKVPFAEKRARRDHPVAYISERLTAGNWLWHAAFCCLSRNYNKRMGKDLFVHWFDGISCNLDRILNGANKDHAYDGLLWTLRSLEELSSLLVLPISTSMALPKSSYTFNKIYFGWETVWSCLMHGLPVCSYVTPIVDAAFKLLGNMAHDIIRTEPVPQEVWDLQCFKHVTSSSVLYFLSCYFSREASQGNLRDSLHHRQYLLRGVLSFVNSKEFVLDEDMVALLPAASYALCAGFSFISRVKRLSLLQSPVDVSASAGCCDRDHDGLLENFEYFVDIVTEIDCSSLNEVIVSEKCLGLRLPQQIRDPLLKEMENCISRAVLVEKIEKSSLSDIFLRCALLSNFIDGIFSTRLTEKILPFCNKVCEYTVRLVDLAVSVIHDFHMDVTSRGCLSPNSEFDGPCSIITSFKSFVCCPLFSRCKDDNSDYPLLYGSIVQSIESLLKAMSDLYVESSKYSRNVQTETDLLQLSASDSPAENLGPFERSRSGIVDIELDVNDSIDLSVSGTTSSVIYCSSLRWKMDLVSLISSCFSVLPVVTWDILFDTLSKERHPKIYEHVLISLCQNPHWSSSEKLMDLVSLMNEMIEQRMSLKLRCADILSSILCLLRTLLSLQSVQKDKNVSPSVGQRYTEESLLSLRDLVSKVYNYDLLDWRGRLKLVHCICDFISLDPLITQAMVEKLIMFLRDPDYRVRLSLARRIGVLLRTWDGHDELFQDMCSNFGVKLVHCSKDKLVTAKDVLADGCHPRPKMETIVVTLMHLAFYSEEVELEAVFMLCAISAMDPSQREFVKAALDNLSMKLLYNCRSKYLDELMGHIVFSWVACGVSLTALVEMRELFVLEVESDHFMLYCCKWVLPSLLLYGDTLQLEWVAQVTNQSLAVLVENHFSHIFAVCMALDRSRKRGWEKGTLVLQSSILRISGMSEDGRDNLIKQHMVFLLCVLHGIDGEIIVAHHSAYVFYIGTIISFLKFTIFGICLVTWCGNEVVGVNAARYETFNVCAMRKAYLLLLLSKVAIFFYLFEKPKVSIVSCILGLASDASDPRAPLFSRETIELAVQAVVDGFLEMGDCKGSVGVIDKINIFRPDRVFMFIVDIHYKVTAAINERHKRHRLSGLEVLIKILGHRAAVSSTSCYLFNLVGQFISSHALQDQCCQIISILLQSFKSNPSKGTTHVLGELLQFLVSKLVACCIPLESRGESTCKASSQVLSLLHLLILDSDPSLHDYIRVYF